MRANIDAIVRAHVPDLTADQITERASKQAHFLAITYTINAQSKEQVVALATCVAGEQRRDHADLNGDIPDLLAKGDAARFDAARPVPEQQETGNVRS